MSTTKSQFLIEKFIGEGTYGVVYRALDMVTHEEVALKKLKQIPDTVGLHASMIREISLLQELSHPNIVKIIRMETDNRNVFVAYELLPSDLAKIIEDKSYIITPSMIKTYMKMVLSSVAYLHSNYMLHRVCSSSFMSVFHSIFFNSLFAGS